MNCQEKEQLLEIYDSLVRAYSRVITALRNASAEEYDALYTESENLLHEIAAARMKLQAHVHQHGC
jgi:hypothetical protein